MSIGEAEAAEPQARRRFRPLRLGFEPLAARLIGHLFRAFAFGTLVVELPAGTRVEFRGTQEGPDARLIVKSWHMLRRSLIEAGRAVEAELTLADLEQGFFIGNALRGLMAAKLL